MDTSRFILVSLTNPCSLIFTEIVTGLLKVMSSLLLIQDKQVEKTREHAASVIRSYYVGSRDQLWLLLLHSQSFSDALTVFQYLKSIAESDKRSLDQHLASYKKLKDLHNQLALTEAELNDLKAQFIAQRIRIVQLQKQLDKS